MKNQKLRFNGFTLIELMAVMGVSSIVLSLMLPAIQQVREKTKLAVCMNNLSQIGKANHLYMVDNNDFFPAVLPGASQSCYGFFGKKGTHQNALAWLEIEQKPLNIYLELNDSNKDTGVTVCPNDDGWALNLIGSTYMTAARSDCHDDLDGDGKNKFQTYSGINHPSVQVFASSFISFAYSQYGWGHPQYQPKNDLHSKGKGKFPYVFVDGHTKNFNIRPTEGISTYPRERGWYSRIDWRNKK